MKELFNKVKNKVSGICKKVAAFAAPALVVMNTMAMADPQVDNIWTVVGSIIGVITTIAMVVGIILLAIGLFQFAMAQRSEDVERKHNAVNVITAALICICFKPLFSGIFTLFGITF